MAKNKKIIEKKVIENEFLDVEIPKLDWVKLDIRSVQTIVNGDVESNDYEVSFFMGEKLTYEDKELSRNVQDVLKLSFAPYYWQEKKYKFYTTQKTGPVEYKKEILKNLFKLFKDYEVKNDKIFESSTSEYENDIKENLKLETPDLILKLNPKTKQFVVLAKDFLGADNYRLLKSCSLYSSTLINPKFSVDNNDSLMLTTDFFKEDVGNKKIDKKTYFIINPQFYLKVKNHFLESKEKQEEFIFSQKEISEKIDLKSLEIKEDNIFDLKIEFNEKDQCFDFYSKGYFEPSYYNGYRPKRNLLGTWALNFIFAEENKLLDTNENSYQFHDEIVFPNKNKINLEEVKGGSKKDKDVKIPVSEWEKIEKIKNNFEKEMIFWSRKTKDIKITHCDFAGSEIFSKYPAIYINDKGECFFAFSSRRMGVFKGIGVSNRENPWGDMYKLEDVNLSEGVVEEKKKREVKFSQTLKTIPISFEEAKFYLNEHPFAENIKRGSINLNGVIHSPPDSLLNQDTKQEVFNKMMLMAEIATMSNKSSVKTKRLKI